jgi:hypothetical protein
VQGKGYVIGSLANAYSRVLQCLAALRLPAVSQGAANGGTIHTGAVLICRCLSADHMPICDATAAVGCEELCGDYVHLLLYRRAKVMLLAAALPMRCWL